jgi:hypothetical protein
LFCTHNQNHFGSCYFCFLAIITLHLKEKDTPVAWERVGQ